MKTGSLIRLLRTAEQLSQTELADELGIARTYLSQVENNRIEPGMGLLKSVSKRFGVPVALLVSGLVEEEDQIAAELQRLLASVLSVRLAMKRT